MFFHIGKTTQSNFPHNHESKQFVVSLDEGWKHTQHQGNDIWFKGYLDSGILDEHVISISQEETPTFDGNFCVIKVFDQGAVVRTDRLRSFPLWYNTTQGLTNLKNIGDTYWTDSCVMLRNDMSIIHSNFDVIGPIENTISSFDEVANTVDQILTNKTKEFLAGLNEPIKVFLSGGIDTALVFSYIQKHTDNYTVIDYLHCDLDYFYLNNHDTLSNLWGYNQIHHWKTPGVLASGAPGDEFMGRSPTTANLMLLYHGTSIPKLLALDKYKDCMHRYYFDKPKYFDQWQDQETNYQQLTLDESIRTCCNYNVNDWQHWHFGNTLTWTPLRNIEIYKAISRLPVDDLADQVMNSVLSKHLIARNNPKILEYLSEQKNSQNFMKNLTKFYCK